MTMSDETMSDEEMFDPTAEEYSSSNGGNYTDLKTAGTYLLGVRKATKHDKTPVRADGGGKRFTRFAFVVIDGKHKGESFTDRVFRDPSAYKRLGYICKAMRITEKFNPAKDPEMERVMVGRTLKAKVEIENGYAQLKYPESNYEENELALMDEWTATFKRDIKKRLDDQRLDGNADFGGSDGGFPANDDIPFPADDFGNDDIPFAINVVKYGDPYMRVHRCNAAKLR